MTRREYLTRRAVAVIVTLWIANGIASPFEPVGEISRTPWPVWWLLLGPVFLGVFTMGGYMAWCLLVPLYQWALGGPSQSDRDARIAELERELGIGGGK